MRFPLTHPGLGIAERGERSILVELRRLVDPKFAVASLVPLCVGAALAWRTSRRIDLGLMAAALLVLFLVEVGRNALATRGLGELAVAAFYGPGIVLGSVVLFGGAITAEALNASIILGILIAVVLLTRELRDEGADRVAGRRTLVVRMGRDLATSLIGVLFAMAFVIPLLTVAYAEVAYFFGALLGIPISYVAYALLRCERGRPPVAGQTATLLAYAVTGLGMAIGAILL